MSMFFRRRLMMQQENEEYVFNETGCVTFVALESTVVSVTIPSGLSTSRLTSISYSLDGVNWVETSNVDSKAVTITAPMIRKGRKISWKGSGVSSGLRNGGTRFYSTGKVNVYGHLTSMFQGENYNDTVPNADNFNYLFSGMPIVSAKDLVLATNVTTRDYQYCFYNCIYLTTPPTLPSGRSTESYIGMFRGCTSLTSITLTFTTLTTNCCRVMFDGCSNLSYIKALFTTEPGDSYTAGWVSGVAASGTFVKSSSAEWDVVGTNGVPSEWNIVYE